MSTPAWLIDATPGFAEHVEAGVARVLPAGLRRVRLPGVRAAVHAALEAAGDGGAPPGCRHLLADARVLDRTGGPILCGRCPAAGVFCGECADSHRDGHGPPAGVCAACGGDGWLRPLVQPIAVRRLICRALDSGTRAVSGPLLVEGLAVCGGCASEADP